MGTRYPDQVGEHKPCEPEFDYVHMSPFGTIFATTVAEDAFGRHGATHDLALRGCWSEWPGECHGKGRVSLERRWSTRM